MKWVGSFILASIFIFLGYRVFSLHGELLETRKQVLELKNESLLAKEETVYWKTWYHKKEKTLSEIERNIAELEDKISLDTLKQHVPRKVWDEIEPIIDRLQALQETSQEDQILLR